ncbi:MAG: hypothetical protein GEU90_09040 [Gemmatimonas sp.]|nr:hypothetical protein [Gemmatimonas sp.]
MTETQPTGGRWVVGVRLILTAIAVIVAHQDLEAQPQLSYREGQNISPAYEGWQVEADGQVYFLFGYMNRNWEEELDIEVGLENGFSPGPSDRGQPTHFLPRRNRFTFRVPVPEGFTEAEELVWTLTSNGVTEKAYASLRPDYLVDNVVIASETGSLGAGTSSPETRSNTPPVFTVEGPASRHASVGQPITLIVTVTDDGLPNTRGARSAVESDDDADDDEDSDSAAQDEEEPELTPEMRALHRALNPPRRVTVGKTNGLHFSWFVYRGTADVEFDPIQVKTWEDTRAGANSPWAPLWQSPPIPEDGRWVVHATFMKPGTYLLRGRADDGGLYADHEITVHVME